jgi:hypothetical protein
MIFMRTVISVGRTVPTFRMILEHVINDWRAFRRALQLHDRTEYDAMMMHAREHAAAASNAARLNPTEALFMAILLEHEKELAALRRKLRGIADDSGVETEAGQAGGET